MAELADALDLGSSAARRGGSSPFTRIIEYAGLAQLVEHLICNQRVEGSNPLAGTIRGSSSVVEHHLAKVGVAGSNPVFRFFFILMKFIIIHEAPIAQLDRVLDYESSGYRFDSCWVHFYIIITGK